MVFGVVVRVSKTIRHPLRSRPAALLGPVYLPVVADIPPADGVVQVDVRARVERPAGIKQLRFQTGPETRSAGIDDQAGVGHRRPGRDFFFRRRRAGRFQVRQPPGDVVKPCRKGFEASRLPVDFFFQRRQLRVAR